MYKEGKLVETITSEEKSSEAIPKIFSTIFKTSDVKRVFFARGPGSFMAIKITYIFLRTLQVTKGVELFASDGFYFTGDKPIKAMKKLYFVKKEGKISTQLFADEIEVDFNLPSLIELEKYSKDIEPLYILPAV